MKISLGSSSKNTQPAKQKSQAQKKAHTQPAFNSGKEIEALDAEIGKLGRTINSANYQLMVLIREFDERAGWAKWGFSDALAWLKWRCDLSTGAARDKLRMAHALKELPLISDAFSTGKLSYTKVRAITRIATPANEAELIDMALRITARHVEEHCKQRRNAQKKSTAAANRANEKRDIRIWQDPSGDTVHFSIELAVDDATVIEKALEKAAVQLSSDTGSITRLPEEAISWRAQQVDALVSVCRSFLDGTGIGVNSSYENSSEISSLQKVSSSTADHYQVVVHVDETALAGSEAGTSQLPIESVRRICCDGSIVPLIESESGEPLNVGRKVRTVPTAIRRALWARDKGCGFPGCTHTRFVDAHHIKHWADGGETSVDNMVLLCSAHHKLVHEGGYSVKRDNAGQMFFRRPDGKAVPHCGYRLDDLLSSDTGFDLSESMDSIVPEDVDSAELSDKKNSQEFFDTSESSVRELPTAYTCRVVNKAAMYNLTQSLNQTNAHERHQN